MYRKEIFWPQLSTSNCFFRLVCLSRFLNCEHAEHSYLGLGKPKTNPTAWGILRKNNYLVYYTLQLGAGSILTFWGNSTGRQLFSNAGHLCPIRSLTIRTKCTLSTRRIPSQQNTWSSFSSKWFVSKILGLGDRVLKSGLLDLLLNYARLLSAGICKN